VGQNLSAAKITLPDFYEAEIFFTEHAHAEKVSNFPGVTKVDGNTVVFQNKDYLEILRTFRWIL